MQEDRKYMKLALKLAKKGVGWVNPNPMVGAVVVKNNTIIGQGYHQVFGGPHAEVNAIRSCTQSPQGATLYVTLEPCIHHGKTPPCAPLILEEGISRVVVAMADPNPKVNGLGIAWLQEHGVEVEIGLLADEAGKLNEVFVKFVQSRKPFCLFKGAMTLDGKIATATGDSKWISGESSRKLVHQLRHQYSAIMAGIGTILKDNPTLTCRRSHKLSKDPLRVVVDSYARIPLDSRIFTGNPQNTLVAVTPRANQAKLAEISRLGAQVVVCPEKDEQVDLEYLMLALGMMDIDSVLLEGGGTLAYSALMAGVIDKVLLFVAPVLTGGKKAPTILEGEGIRKIRDAVRLNNLTIGRQDEDIVIEGYLT